jgi:biopolymer transport protein ExbB/TolQ
MNSPLFPLASLTAALDQDLFPGKILIWLLFMCSILAWVVVLSKGIQVLKAKKGNRRFTLRLRQSHTVLEMMQEGWEAEDSPRYLVYRSAAREAIARILGIHRWDATDLERLNASSRLEDRHLTDLRHAVQSGHRHGMMLLESGLGKFPLIPVAAGILGVFGFGWCVQQSLAQPLPSDAFASQMSIGVAFLGLGLAVAGPVLLATLWFRSIVECERGDLSNFGDELLRLFERCLISGTGMNRQNQSGVTVIKPVPTPHRVAEEASQSSTTASRVGEPPQPGPARLSPKPILDSEAVRFSQADPIRRSKASLEVQEATLQADYALQPDFDEEVPFLQQGKRKYHSLRESLLSPADVDSPRGDEAEEEMNPIARQASRDARSWIKA